MIQIHLSL